MEKSEIKLVKYLDKNIKVSPRKLRILVNQIKRLKAVKAFEQVKFVNSNAARVLTKALKDAIANAKNNYNLDSETLSFETFKVDEGMKIKRMDKSHGSRFARGIILKRHSRLTIILSGKAKEEIKEVKNVK